ncbi:MAG TPA: hypothetical protein P5040_03550 [Smithella sp.]|nr:hypothetical protein [Smithella sp.]HRS97234.1 hypothetical protein [Smithella sp.]
MKKFLLCFLAALILVLVSIHLSFAASGTTGKPQARQKVIIPSTGGGGSSNEPTFDVLTPLNCADEVGYRDCYRSKSQYCEQDLSSHRDQCYGDAVTQCSRVYCAPQKK